jgi:hypothetical protein
MTYLMQSGMAFLQHLTSFVYLLVVALCATRIIIMTTLFYNDKLWSELQSGRHLKKVSQPVQSKGKHKALRKCRYYWYVVCITLQNYKINKICTRASVT